MHRFDSFARALRPKHMIPFASFVRFCNADNAHMNEHKMTLQELQEVSTVPLTVLYPGDSIERGQVISDSANQRHFDAARRTSAVVDSRETIAINELDEKMVRFAQRVEAARFPHRFGESFRGLRLSVQTNRGDLSWRTIP